MANESDKAEDGAAAGPDAAPDKANAKAELPRVDSPPLSPGEAAEIADAETAAEPVAAKPPQTAIALFAAPERAESPAAAPRRWSPRHKRAALLAASVALAAALGAVAGAVSTGSFVAPPQHRDAAAGEERQAMQKSIAHLTKEVASLKTSLEAANKAAHSQVAKTAERLAAGVEEVTGSIAPPQTITPQAATPLPTPRPAPRVAAVETQSPQRPPVVNDWIIREARDGYVYVQGHGEIYQVVPGAPLPGLGPVQTITQRDGRWMVVTPKGIIVSMRDRGFFERF